MQLKRYGKKYQESVKLVDPMKAYDLNEALALVQETAKANFDETVDLAVRLGIDPSKNDQQVRGAVVLPHGTGRTQRVLVFAKGEKVQEAEAAGADYVGDQEYITKINQGWFDFDIVVATPDMMAEVGKIGRVLGPKGLMPNPKTGTVTFEVGKAVSDIKAGKVEYRADKAAIVHSPIGKVSFGTEKLAENFNALMDAIIKAKPAAAKGTYLRSISVSATMGPGIKVNPAAFE